MNAASLTVNPTDRLIGRLKLSFAILTALGGLALALAAEDATIPIVAIFFAAFGYFFVDWLKLFALPPVVAYALMGLAALYCVSDFVEWDNHQMIAVAQLLVFVQAILMMQKKSRRIFEQLGVFCLLELVVAAVFNHALEFGLLLLPIGLVGCFALVLLSALASSEKIAESRELLQDQLAGEEQSLGWFERTPANSLIKTVSPKSVHELFASAIRLPVLVLLAVVPGILLVGLFFFYGIPRTADPARVANAGQTLVGFTDEMRLEQIGQMAQNRAIAARVKLRRQASNSPYQAVGGIYLRGAVLERYQLQGRSGRRAIWSALGKALIEPPTLLPPRYYPSDPSEVQYFDEISVEVACEASNSAALFSIAPYHNDLTQNGVWHQPSRWTISRTDRGLTYTRQSIRFGTHAFHSGVQTDLIACLEAGLPGEDATAKQTVEGDSDRARRLRIIQMQRRLSAQQRHQRYRAELLQFNRSAMPTIERMASRLVLSPDGEPRSDWELAKALERSLTASEGFTYSLNLNSETLPGMDPIEQFVAVDKKGHCQYFASALAMMLRSQGIPARMVVGFYTDELNDLSHQYIARQSHAHAWVEALIDREEFETEIPVYGQPVTNAYWLRLDPTPSASLSRDAAGGVGQVIDLAQNMWDDYVVDMDGKRQPNADGGDNAIQQSYSSWVQRLGVMVGRLRDGKLVSAPVADRNLFSWQGAVVAISLAGIAMLASHWWSPGWLRRKLFAKRANVAVRPTIQFYAESLDQLQRLGLMRQPAQTPNELLGTTAAAISDQRRPFILQHLSWLTDKFYQARFGRGVDTQGEQASQKVLSELTEEVDRLLKNTRE